MSDLMMNGHTCFTANTTYTMLYVKLMLLLMSDFIIQSYCNITGT